MNACLIAQAEYRQWRGPSVPSAIYRPYAVSERVPDDKVWIVLAASLVVDTFPNNQVPSLYAVPPPASYLSRFNAAPIEDGIFSDNPGVEHNIPPLKGGVLLSRGGVAATTKEMLSANSQNTVNLLQFRVILPPRWILVVAQDANGGGAFNFSITFCAMIIPVSVDVLPNELPSPSRRTRTIYGTVG
jgi:hypothetical protein